MQKLKSLGIRWNHSGPFQWDHKERHFLAGPGPTHEAQRCCQRCHQKQRREKSSPLPYVSFIPVNPIGQTYRDARGLRNIVSCHTEQGRERQSMNLKVSKPSSATNRLQETLCTTLANTLRQFWVVWGHHNRTSICVILLTFFLLPISF